MYIQKCVGIPNFQGFAFIRVGSDGCKEVDPEAVKKGLETLLTQAISLKIPVRHILIPYSEGLCKPDFLIETLIDLFDSGKYSKVKEIIISTCIKEDFSRLHTTFQKKVEKLIE